MKSDLIRIIIHSILNAYFVVSYVWILYRLIYNKFTMIFWSLMFLSIFVLIELIKLDFVIALKKEYRESLKKDLKINPAYFFVVIASVVIFFSYFNRFIFTNIFLNGGITGGVAFYLIILAFGNKLLKNKIKDGFNENK